MGRDTAEVNGSGVCAESAQAPALYKIKSNQLCCGSTYRVRGISVKRFVLCAVLIAFVAVVTPAQDEVSENKKDQGSESTLLTSIGSTSHWSLQPKAIKRCRTPLITFLESCPASTLLIPHRKYD